MKTHYAWQRNYNSTCFKLALLFYLGVLCQSALGQGAGIAENCTSSSPVVFRVDRIHSMVTWHDAKENGNEVGGGNTFITTDLSKRYFWESDQTLGQRFEASVLRFAKTDPNFTIPNLNCVNTPLAFSATGGCQGNTFKSSSSAGVYSATGTFPMTNIDYLTMQAWVKWDGQISGGASQCIMLNGNSASSGYALYIDGASKKLAILLGGVALLKSEKTLTTNKWQHVAITRREGVWTLYVDGIDYTVTNERATPNALNANGGGRFSIGKNNTQTDGFTGEIDEVAVWKRDFNLKEVNELRAGVCVTKYGSDGNWNFNEASGTLVNDVSTHGFELSMSDGNARGAGATFQWDFGDGTPVLTTNQPTITHSFETRGRKTVTLTVNDLTNCPSTSSQVISIAGAPSGITATASATTTEMCMGGRIDVMASEIPYIFKTPNLSENRNGWTLGDQWGVPTYARDDVPQVTKGSIAIKSDKIINSSAQMPAFSTIGLKDLFIFVIHFLYNENGTIATMEVSRDATNWIAISTHTDDYPGAKRFEMERIPLPLEMENQAQVYLRFRYNDTKGGTVFNLWHIESVKVGLATYTWSSTPAGINTEEQIVGNISPNVTTTYSLLATNGCDTQRSDVTVKVKLVPTATISGGGNACLNSKTSKVTFKGSGAVGPYTFKYVVLNDRNFRSERTVTTLFGDTVSVLVPTSELGNIYHDLISVSTPTSCEATYNPVVTVKSNVIGLPYTEMSGKDELCQGEQGQINIWGAGGAGPFTFKYLSPDNEIIDVGETGDYLIHLRYNTSNPGTKVFKILSVHSDNGCTYNYPEGGEFVKTITIKPGASVGILPKDQATYCDDPVVLTASGTGNYVWSPGNTLNKTTGAVVVATPKESTTYTVTSELNGCKATASTVVSYAKITVTEPARASSSLVCLGKNVTLIAPKATTVNEPFFSQGFSLAPEEVGWVVGRRYEGSSDDGSKWGFRLAKSDGKFDPGSNYVMAKQGPPNAGDVITHTLTSPAFSTLGNIKLTLNVNDVVTIVKSPKSAANIQFSLDGQNWTTIFTINDQPQKKYVFDNRYIEIPVEFENKPRVYLRFEAIFENQNGSAESRNVWWAIDHVNVMSEYNMTWAWMETTTAGYIGYGKTLDVLPDKAQNDYYAVGFGRGGCLQTHYVGVQTIEIPALTLGAVGSISLNQDYANVPITAYSNFDRLSILSSGAHPMPGFVTRNYENLTSLPPVLPVIVPKVPAGTYDFIMRAGNSVTGCSTDVPFQIVVGSSNSKLSGLTVDVAPPNWDGSQINVSALVKSVVVTATVSDPTAALKINGVPAVSGAATTVTLVSAGLIEIPVTVTAEDHTETTVLVAILKLSNLDVMSQGVNLESEAKVAYALRKLSTIYLHSAITKPGIVPGIEHSDKPIVRVRRSSDNALLDLGYDSSGALDTLTLLRFAGYNDVFVTIWYDQSGNNFDAFQTTLASQPRIVNTGVVERKNYLPTVYFNGGASQNVFLNTASFQGFNGQFSLYTVSGVKTDYLSNQNGLVSKASGGYPAPFSVSGGSFITGNGTQNTDVITLATAFTSTAPFGLWSFRKETSPAPVPFAEFNNRFNISGQTAPTTNYADAGTPLVIGSDQQGQTRLNGWISELILLNQSGSQMLVSENQTRTYLKPRIISFAPVSATELSITGKNFSGAWSVLIGNDAVIFRVVDDNTIIATVNTMASGMVNITTLLGTVSKGFLYGPPPGNALRFDSPIDRVQLNNSLSTPDFTLETWIRTETNSAIGNDPYEGTVLLSASERGTPNGFVLSMLNNKIVFLDGHANKSTFGTVNVVDGRWHHIAVVRRAGVSARIYVDGVADGEGIVAGTAALTASPFIRVAANPENPNLAFRGEMDELRFWAAALSGDDLKAGMLNVPAKPYSSNLKNYYSFDVLTGDPATELDNLASPGQTGTLMYFNSPENSWVESYAMVVPTAQAATDITSSDFMAHWTAPVVGSLEAYTLEISKNPAFPRDVEGYRERQVMPGMMTGGLDPGTAYYYRVAAARNNDDKQGGWSNVIKFNTLHNLDLVDLSLNEGVLEGGFNTSQTDYTSHGGFDDVHVTASTLDATAHMQIKINGGSYADLASNQASAPLTLVPGLNIISVKITADGIADPKVYTITINKPFSPPGNALSFDGVDDNITLDNTTTGNFGTSDFTIELYLRTTQLSAGSILNKRDVCNLTSYLDFIVADGKLKFVSSTDNTGKDYKSLVGNAFVADGIWHHLAVTRAGNVTTIYVDGKTDIAFTNAAIANISNSVPIKIGNSVCENRFVGSMDELRIWDVAKTRTELEAGRRSPAPAAAPGLIAYYNFDMGVNDKSITLENLTGTANKGTLNHFSSGAWVESYAMVVPVITQASYVTSNGFTANWAASIVGASDRYLLDVSASPAFDSFLEGYEALPVMETYEDVTIPVIESGRVMATSYYYRVRSEKDGLLGQGGYSATITVAPSPLPVNLISFTGKRTENVNLLEWKAASEKQFDRYEVERGVTGKDFKGIGTVVAANNLNLVTGYQFADDLSTVATRATSSMFYYRLRMVDQDGSFALSRIITIKNDFGNTQISSLYPNPPISRIAFIDITVQHAGSWQTQVFSTNGILYSSGKAELQKGYNKIRIELQGLPAGVHLIEFKNGSERFVRKVVID